MDLGHRILQFYEFIFTNNFEGGICFYENEFHVTVTCDGNIYSQAQAPTLTEALDQCGEGLYKGGF